MSHSLVVMPDDSAQPILDAIHGAKTSLYIKMFVFSDQRFLEAVTAAQRRNVKVRVMLNPARRSGQADNEQARQTLVSAGVEVIDSNPAYDITHEKSLVVDEATAFIHSLNWETGNLEKTRDYAIITSHKHEVAEITCCFEADWHRGHFAPAEETNLLWCKGNARERFAKLIDRAKHTILVQNERYQDPVIIEHLVRASMRGVKIHMLARPPHTLKQEKLLEGLEGLRILNDVGVKINILRHMKLHAKMLLADSERAIVGSINLTPGSFDSRRELAIEVIDQGVIKRLCEVAHHDWKHSRTLDLTDEGIRKDLGEGAEICDLALNCSCGQ